LKYECSLNLFMVVDFLPLKSSYFCGKEGGKFDKSYFGNSFLLISTLLQIKFDLNYPKISFLELNHGYN
jgi:hypothetical protein